MAQSEDEDIKTDLTDNRNLIHFSSPWPLTFKIYLPRVEEKAKTITKDLKQEEQRSGTESVLLVEDELAVRGLAVRLLRELGYTVLDASNGEEAFRIAHEHPGPIHLLITDVVMPDIGGRTLANQIGLMRPEIKILFMSGYTGNAIEHHGVLDPGREFLQKPFTHQTLARKVREVLDKRPVSHFGHGSR